MVMVSLHSKRKPNSDTPLHALNDSTTQIDFVCGCRTIVHFPLEGGTGSPLQTRGRRGRGKRPLPMFMVYVFFSTSELCDWKTTNPPLFREATDPYQPVGNCILYKTSDLG